MLTDSRRRGFVTDSPTNMADNAEQAAGIEGAAEDTLQYGAMISNAIANDQVIQVGALPFKPFPGSPLTRSPSARS